MPVQTTFATCPTIDDFKHASQYEYMKFWEENSSVILTYGQIRCITKNPNELCIPPGQMFSETAEWANVATFYRKKNQQNILSSLIVQCVSHFSCKLTKMFIIREIFYFVTKYCMGVDGYGPLESIIFIKDKYDKILINFDLVNDMIKGYFNIKNAKLNCNADNYDLQVWFDEKLMPVLSKFYAELGRLLYLNREMIGLDVIFAQNDFIKNMYLFYESEFNPLVVAATKSNKKRKCSYETESSSDSEDERPVMKQKRAIDVNANVTTTITTKNKRKYDDDEPIMPEVYKNAKVKYDAICNILKRKMDENVDEPNAKRVSKIRLENIIDDTYQTLNFV